MVEFNSFSVLGTVFVDTAFYCCGQYVPITLDKCFS